MPHVTSREYEIITLRAQGMTVKEVASKLRISESAVNQFTKCAFWRCNVDSLVKFTALFGHYEMRWVPAKNPPKIVVSNFQRRAIK